MIKIAVFGYGNVGKAAVEACLAANDIELAGVVSRSLAGKEIDEIKFVDNYTKLLPFDAAILAMPTRLVPDCAEELLKKGIYTADSFDIHSRILEVRSRLDLAAKEGGAAAVTAAGWDPGSDSVVRTLLEAMAPKGITYTNFGPGMSMGHSVAAKAVEGVKDALSLTIPLGTSIHRRMVYIEVEDGVSPEDAAAAIKADDYFSHDETYVIPVDSVKDVLDMGSGVHIERKGVSGATHNQLFSFDMKINNPALTSQILVASARAALRQRPGCYTLIEIPPVDLLPGSRDDAVARLV